ncbi:MAG: hypothetical protein KC646_07355 [Candidatus Cloacimonetes bacterium]|nr:hypothetical protein [Candidatus Cloacimonadota bacterium]
MKKQTSNILFNLLCVITVFVVLIGCSDTAIQDTLISPTVNSYSVVRGVITDSSIRLESKSRVSQSVASAEESTSTIGVDMALMTDQGLILQRRSFQKRNNQGNFEFVFEGEFPKEALRIRVFEVGAFDGVYDIAIGTAASNDESIELGDYKDAAIATRYLEQTHSYLELKKQGISSFQDTLNQVISKKINGADDKDLFIQNFERLGVDSQGKLSIFPSNYSPSAKRNPSVPTTWEDKIFEDEVIEEVVEEAPILIPTSSKRLVNFVYQALDLKDAKVLYDSRAFRQTKIVQRDRSIEIVFRMIRTPLLEQKSYLDSNLSLLIVNGNHREQVALKDLPSRWENQRDLIVSLNLNSYIYIASEELGIYLQDALPSQEDEILQVLAGIHLDINF